MDVNVNRGLHLRRITYQFFQSGATLGERVTDIRGYFFPVCVVMFDAGRQIESIPLEDVL